MKILQVTGPGSVFTITETPLPEPGPGEARVRILGVATCPQWDLHLRHNEPMFVGHQFHYPYTPGQPGHEATGVIDALGPDTSPFALGERVSVWRDAGHSVQGCYSFLRLRQLNAFPCTRFGISGLGPAGLIAAQLARAEGAKEIIAWDLSAARRTYALERGLIDVGLDPREQMTPPPAPVEVALDCVGAKASVEFLMDRTHGILALFGVQREPYTFEVRHYSRLILCGYPGHSRAAAEYAVAKITEGTLDLSCLITHTLPFSRYAEGIALLERQEAIKILFVPE